MIDAKGKHLTIKELFDEMKVLRSRLIKLSHKYNRSLIGINAISYKDIMVKGGKKDDVMLNNTIKREEIENEFDIVKESYESYREEAIKEIREMIATKPVDECIVYFRDTLNWKWNDISKLFNYSRIHCIRLYNKRKKTDVTL